MVSVFMGDRWASIDERELKKIYTRDGIYLYVYDTGSNVIIILENTQGVKEVVFTIDKGNTISSDGDDRFCDAYFGM